MSELKPCPFCGRTPIVDDCGDNRYFVKCKCGIVQDKLYAQKCDAVRRWNTRKTGKIAKDTNVPSNDCISRQAAIDVLSEWLYDQSDERMIDEVLLNVPSTQPEHTSNNDCNGCKFVGCYDTDFPCANCIRKNKDYYAPERRSDEAD